MYNKIQHLSDVKELAPVPVEVLKKIKEIAKSLDDNYGIDSRDNEDGGFIIYVTNKDDLELVCELELDVELSTVEYVETINTPTGAYINALFLLNNEFAVTVIMPKEIATLSLLEDCEGNNG